jgi:predicted nuclease of predicted toxin-antitoxin system
MKILVDMNLSPDWVEVFNQNGWESLHWSAVGAPSATDRVIMEWARVNGYVVFTHDLDFGMLLAFTRANGPSVVQVRTQDVMPSHLGHRLVQILRQYESLLESGVLITVDEEKSRLRILSIGSRLDER